MQLFSERSTHTIQIFSSILGDSHLQWDDHVKHLSWVGHFPLNRCNVIPPKLMRRHLLECHKLGLLLLEPLGHKMENAWSSGQPALGLSALIILAVLRSLIFATRWLVNKTLFDERSWWTMAGWRTCRWLKPSDLWCKMENFVSTAILDWLFSIKEIKLVSINSITIIGRSDHSLQ